MNEEILFHMGIIYFLLTCAEEGELVGGKEERGRLSIAPQWSFCDFLIFFFEIPPPSSLA